MCRLIFCQTRKKSARGSIQEDDHFSDMGQAAAQKHLATLILAVIKIANPYIYVAIDDRSEHAFLIPFQNVFPIRSVNLSLVLPT